MPLTNTNATGHKAADGAAASASASTSHVQASSSTNKRLKDSHERPWVHKEDAVLLRYMAQYCDLKEKGMKVAGWFRRDGKVYGVPSGPPRDYDDILRRCERLQTEFFKYDLIVESPRAWPSKKFERFNSPLWDFDHVEAARRYKAIWEDDSEEEEEEEEEDAGDDQAQAHKKPNEESGEQSEAGKDCNKKQGARQSEVAGGSVASSSDSGHDEAAQGQQKDSLEDAESEEETSSSESSEGKDEEEENAGVEGVSHVSSSGQQQYHEDQHAGKKKEPTDQSTRSPKRKKEKTLLVKADRKRMRIGIAPKGTKVTYYPSNGSVQIIF